MPVYESRQVGKALIGVAVIQALIGLWLLWISPVAGAAIIAVALLTPWLFATMTVRVSEDAVAFWFGPGLVRRTIPLADIRAARVATLPWYSGVGIHWTMNGMLYNVTLGPVAQVELTNGTRVNIGSAEPEALVAAIRGALGTRHIDSPPVPHAHGMPWPLVSALLVGCVALGVSAIVVWNGRRPVDIAVTNDAFTAGGAGYSTSLPISEITSVSIDDSLPHVVRRTNGFAMGETLRGDFTLDPFGAARLYVDRATPPFVTVHAANGALVIVNERTPEATRALFEDLRRRLSAK